MLRWLEVGVCGLSCRLCPMHHSGSESRCIGCKSESRMVVGCPFITCAVKKKGIEFCWNCEENTICEKWKKHREASKNYDSFVCYQKLEENIQDVLKNGVEEFEREQIVRENLLKKMLIEFNEGRSKTYYCIALTVLEVKELESAINQAKKQSEGLGIKEKSKVLHQILNTIAEEKGYCLKLRK
jgi:hypothetical protein